MKKPIEIVQTVVDLSVPKVQQKGSHVFLLGLLAGAYIAFGGVLAIKIGGGLSAWKDTLPGLIPFVFGAVFPVGLVLVVVAGAELFTGNVALLTPGWLQKKISGKEVLKNWGISYLGNFIGSISFAFLFVYLTNLFTTEPWLSTVQTISEKKVNQDFLSLLLKGIACNWLVCLAIWLSIAAQSFIGKVVGIWFPIMAFVALGFEHSVANMFFIPLGIFYESNVSWMEFLINNLLPVTIGNIIGGGVFVALTYTSIFSSKLK